MNDVYRMLCVGPTYFFCALATWMIESPAVLARVASPIKSSSELFHHLSRNTLRKLDSNKIV